MPHRSPFADSSAGPALADPPESSATPPIAAPPRRHTAVRWLFILLGILAILIAAVWAARAPILTEAARAYIVDDAMPDHADALIVLGGGMNYRPTEAARIYRLGVAPKILVAQPIVTEAVALGLAPPEGRIAAHFLAARSVPQSAIELLAPEVSSTYEEALAARGWVEKHGARRVVIPTDIFHTRRVKWIFEKVLLGTGVEVRVTAIDPIRYSPDNWWQREEGLSTFQNEVVKLLYYWLRY